VSKHNSHDSWQYRIASLACIVVLSLPTLFGQTATLVLSSASAAGGGTANLSLMVASSPGNNPAGLQWTFTYPAGSVAALIVTPDAALIASGKTIACAIGAGSYTCFAAGFNANLIPDGKVATVTVSLGSGAGSWG